MIDPAFLQEVFKDLFERTQSSQNRDRNLARLNLVIQDGSLWSALPRMTWAEYGVGRKGEAKGVGLHF